jgi:hypothetical protein
VVADAVVTAVVGGDACEGVASMPVTSAVPSTAAASVDRGFIRLLLG